MTGRNSEPYLTTESGWASIACCRSLLKLLRTQKFLCAASFVSSNVKNVGLGGGIGVARIWAMIDMMLDGHQWVGR